MLRISFILIGCLCILPTVIVAAPGKKMVCYFGSWAVYRPGAGKFDVESIDPMLCTHVVYGFTGLRNGEIASLDGWNERCEGYGKGAYERFTKLKEKNPELKVIVAIGGWNEGSIKYSQMSRTREGRRKFIDSVIVFLDRFKFDGLDLDWEYPANRDSEDYPEDKQNFAHLVRETREEFDKYGYLLTAAVSAGEPTIKKAYDIPTISRYFHFISIMAYDFHGAWDKHTGHHSPLYRNPLDVGQFEVFNVNHSVSYWIANGAPRDKLVLGMGTYGRGVTLNKAAENGLYAPGDKPIRAGPYTREAGFWGYNEICDTLRREPDRWTVVTDPYYMAPYAYNGREWIGYDTPESIKIKAEYARDMGLAGGMVWSLETDDFHGQCHGETFPLIKTIYRTIIGPYPGYEWHPAPPRSTSNLVCDYYKPTWVPQTPKTTTPYPPLRTYKPDGGGYAPSKPRPTQTYPRPTHPPKPDVEQPEPVESQPAVRPPKPVQVPDVSENEIPVEEHPICSEEGIAKDPQGDCSRFYICHQAGSKWKSHVQHCPSGTAFDPKIKACNHPGLVNGCQSVKSVSYYRQGSL
jgi:chitinase